MTRATTPTTRTAGRNRNRPRLAALAVDLDRTLGPAGRGPSSAGLRALSRARERGLNVIIASGRSLAQLKRLVPPGSPVDAYVAENGAIVRVPERQIERVVGLAVGKDVRSRLSLRPPVPIVFGRVIASFPRSASRWAASRVAGLPVEVVRNVDRDMIVPVGVSKATGIALALRELRLGGRPYAAVGDGENDLPMLAAALLSAAVGNATRAAKQVATLTCRRPMGRGVLEFVEGPLTDFLRR